MSSTAEIPTFVDTHTHLDDGRFANDLDQVLAAASAVGIRQIVNIGYRPLRWESSIALSQRHPHISFTLGLHPHHADEFTDALLNDLDAKIAAHRPVALGEIGLDYFRDLADRGLQRHAFASQLALAVRNHLPVIIHMRGDVEADLVAELDRTPSGLTCILHSFDGTAKLAAYARERGFLYGVGGLVTQTSNVVLRNIVSSLPIELLVLETDSPYLTPAGVKDRRNSPVNIPVIATAVANLKGVSVAEVAEATTRSAVRTLGLPMMIDDATESVAS